MGVGLNTYLRHYKELRPQSVTSRMKPVSDVIVCAEWTNSGAMCELDTAPAPGCCLTRITELQEEQVVAHVFGERTMATLGRLMSLLSPLTW